MIFWDALVMICSWERFQKQIELSPVSELRLICVTIVLQLLLQLVNRIGVLRRSARWQIFWSVTSLCLSVTTMLLGAVFVVFALLCVFEVAFYISPLILFASTWFFIYCELYRAFRMRKSRQNGSLRQF
ncbi:hypothetical protein JCM8547_007753 [Rhodosporidiobolus lusitaniae]